MNGHPDRILYQIPILPGGAGTLLTPPPVPLHRGAVATDQVIILVVHHILGLDTTRHVVLRHASHTLEAKIDGARDRPVVLIALA